MYNDWLAFALVQFILIRSQPVFWKLRSWNLLSWRSWCSEPLMLVLHNNLTLCTFLKLYIYVHINCAMPTSQFRHPGEGGGGGDGVQSLKFPSSLTPVFSVCVRMRKTVQCSVCARERLCVCNGGGGEPPRPPAPPPVAQTPPAAIAPSGGGGGGCALRRIFCRTKPGQSRGTKRNGCFCKDFSPKVDLASGGTVLF